MFSKPKVRGGGAKFTDMLALLFILLRINGVIQLNWWWVLCPLWIPLAISFIISDEH